MYYLAIDIIFFKKALKSTMLHNKTKIWNVDQ